MKRIIFLKGLPSSGKTVYAKKLIDENPGMFKRINNDDLRSMLDNSKWTPNNEKFILKIRDILILEILKNGKSVILDNTHLNPKHWEHIKQLVFTSGIENVEIELKDFTDVPLETCLDRDEKRENRVGSRVIMQMYRQFLKPKPPIIARDPKLPDAIIVDIDGTLALFGDANPYDRDFSQDKLNPTVANIIMQFINDEFHEFKLIIVSGRKDSYRKETVKWLHKHDISYRYLFMRQEFDNRKDSIVKKEIYDNNIKGKFNVEFVLDDRNSVVDLWRSEGLICLQVAEGDF